MAVPDILVSSEQRRLIDDSTFHFLAVRRFHREHGVPLPIVSPVLLNTWIVEFLSVEVPHDLIIHVWQRWIAAGYLERADMSPSLFPELMTLRPTPATPSTFDYIPTLEFMAILESAAVTGRAVLDFSVEKAESREVSTFVFPDLNFCFDKARAKAATVRIECDSTGRITFFKVNIGDGTALSRDEEALVVLAATGEDWPLKELGTARDALIASTGRKKRGRPSFLDPERDGRRGSGGRKQLERELERIQSELPFLISVTDGVMRPGPGLRIVRILEDVGATLRALDADGLTRRIRAVMKR